ncbi:Mitochondrial transcription termination factor family protein [Thalictrum thalictroides]|uniref:Mitochondrial transcription termination factor family protein n=1 Tax=Thalictrum thalictroides TaxID=46969 RepID=A0A7J6V7T3_THATH|nr:Mitochondrial transcription termination factor family protein [Thalictrum thalictroides]
MYHQHPHHLLKHLLQNYPSSSLITIRFISSCKHTSKPNQFTIDYLINSCGLSPVSALKASKHIILKPSTTKRPDSVLSLFKTYGFTNTHISKLVAANPFLLLLNTEKAIKPKLDFFSNIGITGPNLGKFLTSNGNILRCSLENKIIPSINFLRGFVKTDTCIAKILNRCCWGITDAECLMGPNIAILQDHGVPKANISKFILASPRIFFYKPEQFYNMVIDIKKMGFNPSSVMFGEGLNRVRNLKNPIWDTKMAVFKSFGWSEDEVLSLFKKQPMVVGASLKKLNSALDFFMNTLKWTRNDVSKNPSCMLLSLEKRVVPRSCVLQILLSKDLISRGGMGQGLRESEDVFLKKYVLKYQLELPELSEVYQSKMSSPGLKFRPQDIK